jgi:hypothetical protein
MSISAAVRMLGESFSASSMTSRTIIVGSIGVSSLLAMRKLSADWKLL